MKNRYVTAALVPFLFLLAPGLGAQPGVPDVFHFVVQHDSAAVKLTSRMLQGLIGSSSNPIAGAFLVDPKTQTAVVFLVEAGKETQPSGVFAGMLKLTFTKEPAAEKRGEILERVVKQALSKLQKELTVRLFQAQRNDFVRREAEQEMRAKRLQNKLRKIRESIRGVMPVGLASTEAEADRLVAVRASANLDRETDEPMLQSLQDRLAKAGSLFERTGNSLTGLDEFVRRTEAKLVGELDQKKIEQLRQQIEDATRKHRELTANLQEHARTVELLSTEVQQTTTRVHRTRFRLRAVERQLKSRREELAGLRAKAQRAQLLADEAQAIEAQIVAARADLQTTQRQQRALRPVRVSRW